MNGAGAVRAVVLAAIAAAAPAMAPAMVPAVAWAAPPTLGDGLRAIGAFEADETREPGEPEAHIDPRLVPPPPSETVWPRVVIVTGVALMVAGIAGLVASPGCATRDGAGRCVDARGSDPLWPSLVVIGLGATVTGNYWDRWTRLPDSHRSVPPARRGTP
jgi:hypothetical protein